MKKFNKEILESINIFPFDLENKDIFVKRFCKSFDARATFKSKLDRLLAANKIWETCKANSMVSVTTSKEEYLLFS